MITIHNTNDTLRFAILFMPIDDTKGALLKR